MIMQRGFRFKFYIADVALIWERVGEMYVFNMVSSILSVHSTFPAYCTQVLHATSHIWILRDIIKQICGIFNYT